METTSNPRLTTLRRLLLLVLLACAILTAWLYRDALNPLQWTDQVRQSGVWGMGLFILLYTLATILFLPGSMLTMAGGVLFGPWLGGMISLLGATLGASIAFLIARYLAADQVTKRASGMLEKLLAGVESEGWRFVVFVRLVPVFPFNLLNYALGLTRIRFDHYVLATLICMAPGGLAYAWLGHAGKEAISGHTEAIQAGMWALGLMALAWLIPRWIKRGRGRPNRLLLLALLGGIGPVHGMENAPGDCLSCHQQRDAALVRDWEQSRHHQNPLHCASCHSGEHDGHMAARSRRNEACLECHAREAESYLTSKHGVIATLEAARMDFSQPLREGNLRAPTCAYCHLHQNNHNRADKETPCLDCHAPRLVSTWFATGAQMIEIGQMKVREATRIISAQNNPPQEAKTLLHQMQTEHLANIRLGVGHQSPDAQWWHGHPALDGDLLRIKSMISTILLNPH